MKLRWATRARADYVAYLRYLRSVAPASAKRCAAEVERTAAALGQTPLMTRASRWPELREWSLVRWRKILVLRVDQAEVVIVAFVDARQDLSKAIPQDD